MSLTISPELLKATKSPAMASARKDLDRYRTEEEYTIRPGLLSAAVLDDLDAAATQVKDRKVLRAIQSIRDAGAGEFAKAVANFKAFEAVLTAYLKHGLLQGWIFVTAADGRLYPELVTDVLYDDGNQYRREAFPTVAIHTVSYGAGTNDDNLRRLQLHRNRHVFRPTDVANRRIADILEAKGIFKETADLCHAYAKTMDRFHSTVRNGFAEQYRACGAAWRYEDNDYRRRGLPLKSIKVINDSSDEDYGTATPYADSKLFEAQDEDHPGVGAVPETCVVRFFDLVTHEYLWVGADNLTPYVYDQTLRNKLILPATHTQLLDVLTTNIDDFVGDLVVGKSASNVILCKGNPGVGKTLTAEVYAELIGRPLYVIHSGVLGTTATEIEEVLQEVFQVAKRLNVVLLLDECDVFVARRGNDIQQNAVTAVFLRAMEYFDRLLFVTTNRPDDIDDAFIQRCAAVIQFTVPQRDGAALVWGVMADQYGVKLPPPLLEELLDAFPSIAPRDCRELFRLTLRMCKSQAEVPTIDAFRKWAPFRAIEIAAQPA